MGNDIFVEMGMTTTIKLDRKHHEHLVEIEEWCRTSVGLGSRRFVKNTWMGMDDWYYFEERVEHVQELTEEQIAEGEIMHVDASDDVESDLIFVFRRESDASLFSLRWQ
jgi:hypothetical protein